MVYVGIIIYYAYECGVGGTNFNQFSGRKRQLCLCSSPSHLVPKQENRGILECRGGGGLVRDTICYGAGGDQMRGVRGWR